MKSYVYELVNDDGNVEYVGESINPEFRFKRHTHYKPHKASNVGKFYGRNDLKLKIIKEFNSKKEAFQYQCELQSKYGFTSDMEKCTTNGIKGKPFGHLGWKVRKQNKQI
jgi:hypothetical protein